MINYEITGSGGVKVGGEGIYSVVVETNRLILEDVKFFLDESRKANTETNRYARACIIFMPFYFESLVNLLIDELGMTKEEGEKNDKRNDLPLPIRMVRAVYYRHYRVELPIDINGIRDQPFQGSTFMS
jgi:hypothetical protein